MNTPYFILLHTDASQLLQAQIYSLTSSLLLNIPAASRLPLHFAFLPSWCFSSHLLLASPSALSSLQASVIPYIFHSSSDAHGWQGQSGSQVEKWTANSYTHTHTH